MSKRRGQNINGWLVLDKEIGMTSTQAVGKAKRVLNAKKAGHAGTLDPLATGILPIAFGEATKTVQYLMGSQKAYRFCVQWGAETNTDDCEGEITHQSDIRPGLEEIEAVLPDFIGDIEQVPPQYSAIKVKGERAYHLARKGEDFELSSRIVKVYNLKVIEAQKDKCTFEVDCGKGTYVRSLARDMGRKLGCLGHVIELRRTKLGIFREADALTFDKMLEMLDNLSHSAAECEAFSSILKPVETALDDIPVLAISEADAWKLRNGQPVLLKGRDAPLVKGPVYTTTRGKLVAVGEVQRGELKPLRVFNLP